MTKMNTPIEPDDDREAYYAEARSWGADRAADAARSRRIAWIVAAIATAIAALEALALIAPSTKWDCFQTDGRHRA